MSALSDADIEALKVVYQGAIDIDEPMPAKNALRLCIELQTLRAAARDWARRADMRSYYSLAYDIRTALSESDGSI